MVEEKRWKVMDVGSNPPGTFILFLGGVAPFSTESI